MGAASAIRYVLSHVVDKSTAGVGVYRYRLERSDHLAESDGLVILESVGAQATQVTEYGFFLPRPAPVPAALIWREGVRGAFLSAAAIKHKSENPSWSYRQIALEGERLVKLQADDVEHCLAQRNDSKARLELLLLEAR